MIDQQFCMPLGVGNDVGSFFFQSRTPAKADSNFVLAGLGERNIPADGKRLFNSLVCDQIVRTDMIGAEGRFAPHARDFCFGIVNGYCVFRLKFFQVFTLPLQFLFDTRDSVLMSFQQSTCFCVNLQFCFFPSGHIDITHQDAVSGPGTVQDSKHRVVIRCWDRIELMIVAAGAPKCQTQDRSANGVDLFVSDIKMHLGFVAFRQHFWRNHQETSRNHLSIPLFCA